MNTPKFLSIVLLFTLLTLGLGCTESNSGEQKSSVKEQVQQQVPKQQTPSAEVDKFGRKPGEQHYGHNHSNSEGHGAAPKTNSAQPANGAPDKFGRKPGDQHYGHNHQ